MSNLIKISKWVIIVFVSLFFLNIHWTAFILFVGIIVYSRIKKRKPASTEIENNEFRQYQVKVAGITFKNDDGSSRTDIAFSCRSGQKLVLVRDPENTYDKNAVKIMTENNLQLGHLDAWNAKELQATLKGTSKKFSHVEATFVEAGMFTSEDKKDVPYCTISIQRHYAK